MDPHTFDGVARRLSRIRSRRALVGSAVAASILAAAGLGGDVVAKKAGKERCLPPGKRCGTKKNDPPCRKCCQRYVITDPNGRKKCACRPDGEGCTNSAQCCSGACESNVCRGSSSPCRENGVSCTVNTDCCSNVCGDGFCQPVACAGAGQVCTVPANCCSGRCALLDEFLFISICRRANCVAPVEDPEDPEANTCTSDADCCAGFCLLDYFPDHGVCVTCGCPPE